VTDLPPLPADFDPEALVPEAFLERPPADAGDLTLDSVTVIREWLAYLREEGGVITIHMLDDDEIEQAVSALVDDYRRQGIDLWDRRDLLSTVWTTQTCLVALLGNLAGCVAGPLDVLHVYSHVTAPLANVATTLELLILAVFGEEAAL
jgi:hypothetical protein